MDDQAGNNQSELNSKLKSQNEAISRLNQEADGLKIRLQQVEEHKTNLNSNKQFKESQEKYEGQIQMLESDKVSLMKRLNMVLSELEKATQEKTELNTKLMEQDRHVDVKYFFLFFQDLKRKLDEVSSLKNVVNRNLQEDLRYERDLNEKLREELGRFDQEKGQLLQKLKTQEELTKEISRETSAINDNLKKKTNDLRSLEDQHEANLARLRDVNNQLDQLRQSEHHSQSEKLKMEDELGRLQNERSDLIARMNQVSDKYEDYVSTMTKEREEMIFSNKQHVKLLTAKLFAQILTELVHFRRKDAIQQIGQAASEMGNMEYKLHRFTRIMITYNEDRRRHYVRLWYTNSMNFLHENYKKLNLVEFNVEKKRKMIYYYKWRTAFLHKKKNFECKTDGAKVLQNWAHKVDSLDLRRALCKWKDHIRLRNLQEDAIMHTFGRRIVRDSKEAFIKWLAETQKSQSDKRYQTMADIVTTLWFKQKVFLAMRHACMEQRAETSISKFKAWRNWCEENKKSKFFVRKEALVDKIWYTRQERLLKQVFDALKYSAVNEKYERTKAELDKDVPIRLELEQKKETLIKVGKTRDKHHCLRQMIIRHKDLLYRAFMIWKEAQSHHEHTMDRVKMRLIHLHKNNLASSFFKWKDCIDKQHVVQLVQFTEDVMNENQDLTNNLEKAKEKQTQLSDCSTRTQGLKLERIRNMLYRNLVRFRFNQWANNTEQINHLEDALFLTSKTIRRWKLRNGFNKYKKQVEEAKRLEYVENKVAWFEKVRQRQSLDRCVDTWKMYVRRYKMGKAFLARSIRGVDKLISNEAFNTWKTLVFRARRQVYEENIEELEKRQVDHEQQVKTLKNDIEKNEAVKMHLETKMVHQNHKIMANFISRFIHTAIARGFYTWLDELKEYKNKRRFLRSCMSYWIRNRESKAFRQWAENSLKQKEHELSTQYHEKETERRQLQWQKEDDEKAQGNEVETLQQNLTEARQTRDQLKANFDKALKTHTQRKENNVYIDKTANIFHTWRNYLRAQKNSLNVIVAIARMNLKEEVFARIKVHGRTNFLDSNAERITTNFFRLFKQNQCRAAFSKWRGVNYYHAMIDMEQKKKLLADTKIAQAHELQVMTEQKLKKAERVLLHRRQKDISLQWIEQAKITKALETKDGIFKDNMNYYYIKKSLKKWHSRTQVTKYMRRKDKVVINKWKMTQVKRIFNAWANRKQVSKDFTTKTFKFVQRMQYVDLAFGFHQILNYTKSKEERQKERKKYGQKSIEASFNRMIRNRLSEAFHELKTRAATKEYKEAFLRRCFKHALDYRVRHFFSKWKHNHERQQLADFVNTEGDVVLERNKMSRKVESLKEFLNQQGYEPEFINQYLEKKDVEQKANMQKAVVGFFFKNSEFSVIPKAMNHWKRFVQMRKLMRKYADMAFNAMRHPLYWEFRKWKLSDVIAKDALRSLNKKELVDKVIADDMAIHAAKGRLERMEEAIDHLNLQRDNLLQHFISGQKLAIALVRSHYQKATFKAFFRWKRECRRVEQERLAEQLNRTNQMIADLMDHLGKLENINTGLNDENEELRQAAMDGIEIAKAVQDMTKEREILSTDLQERSTTIKKLIEDNNNLSTRLTIAQREAEQLEALNNQSYLNPPERESYY